MKLAMPVIGLESEFKVFINDAEVAPENVWRTPAAFIDQPLLRRSTKASQLPTGGAVYFDGGVIEVVTPVIELAPRCTARAVRSLWEQIAFIRSQLDRWENQTAQRVRLQAFSAHVNVSFELTREERGRNRTIQKLAYLLARLLPIPVIILGGNRRSTGVGVRPRRDRVEITLDFTPDPALMAATVALIVGVVRELISRERYLVSEIDLPLLTEVEKHPSRKGWVARGVTADREGAYAIAFRFRDSIRRYSDPVTFQLIFAVLRGEAKSLLDLEDRPAAYDDIGRAVRLEPQPLSRSRYEQVFRKIANRQRLKFGNELLTPVAVKGWYQTVFRAPNGEERILTIDEVLASYSH